MANETSSYLGRGQKRQVGSRLGIQGFLRPPLGSTAGARPAPAVLSVALAMMLLLALPCSEVALVEEHA